MIIASSKEFEYLRQSGKILSGILNELCGLVKPGIETSVLEERAKALTHAAGAVPAFLGYRGYANALCVSLNDEVVHGMSIPSRVIHDGDVVSLDFGVTYHGFITDSAVTVIAGRASKETRALVEDTKKSLLLGLSVIQAGATTGDIGFAISNFLTSRHYGIVTALSGHGVGKDIHEPPTILNIGYPGKGEKLVEGMVIAVEPMVTLGSGGVDFDKEDGWTVRTSDHALAAHWEHTVVVTKNGCEVLTA